MARTNEWNERRRDLRNLRVIDDSEKFHKKNGVHIERSLNVQSVISCQAFIEMKILEDQEKNRKSASAFTALSSLLDELLIRKVMAFDECFKYYTSHIKDITQLSESVMRNAKQTFKEKLLGHAGLPVIYLTTGVRAFVMLMENGVNQEICNSFEEVLESIVEELQPTILNEKLKSFTPVFEHLMSLTSTNKDRYLLLYILSNIFSKTGLKEYLGLNPDFVSSVQGQVEDMLWSVPDKMTEFENEAATHVEETVLKLRNALEKKSESLAKKRKRLDENIISDYESDIANKRQKLETLQEDSTSLRKQYVYRKFRAWKSDLWNQKGKKRGSYLIDRGAENAIYNVLAEHSKAHRRRHGEEGTAYLDEPSQRIQSREMLRIANKFLKKNNKRLIKSKETVRAFGKPRNKRSVQAKQHRGKSLWSFTRSQKKECNRHVNVHYNRAFIKNYTRLAFAKNSKHRGRVLRLAVDDKCYLRCGTSEGFSRPLHRPLQLAKEELKFELPSSDYPKKTGYVSPGVVLMVNEQSETEYNGRDKYVPEDVTVSVNCKPKVYYPSHATNWANDLYSSRLLFREEHELPSNFSEEHGKVFLEPTEAASHLIFIRDSLLQFELMTIEADFLRISDGSDHRAREELRLDVLKGRIESVTNVLTNLDTREDNICSTVVSQLHELKSQVEDLQKIVQVSCPGEESKQQLLSEYGSLKSEARRVRLQLESLNLPKHRAIEIQTSDAGPGVNSKEKVTQIRLAEAFQIHSLDLQARLHYAPGDSRVHIAEKVMRSLNEHAGSGHTIPIPSVPLTSIVSPGEILIMKDDELNDVMTRKEQDEAYQCAKSVALLYDGKPCMGTSIHARVPNDCSWDGFFFDHEFLVKCSMSSSAKALNACAGSAYFKYQQTFFSEHYRVYDGGVEAIRDACEKKCHFHASVENTDRLNADGWSDLPVQRVNAPVPDYNEESSDFHYCSSEQVESGNFMEKFSLSKAKVMSKTREVDDYCPRTQLHKLIKDCGKPQLSYNTTTHDDGSQTLTPVDSNETMTKVTDGVDALVIEFVGEDLRDEVLKEAKKQVELEIKATMKKTQKKSAKESAAAKHVDDIDWEHLAKYGGLTDLSIAELNLYLTECCGMSVEDAKKKGFNKRKKVKLIKENIMCGHIPNTGVSLKMTVQRTKSHTNNSLPPVPPWAGSTVYNGNVVRLQNTCPIDNWLTMFHFICTLYPAIVQAEKDLFYQRIMGVHRYFQAGEFVLGKMHWLEMFPHKVDLTQPVIDIFGSEYDFFISAMANVLATTYNTVCSESTCPKPSISSKSSEIILSDAKANTPENSFKMSVCNWLHKTTPSPCLRKKKRSSSLCQGSRTESNRFFIQGMPLVLPCNVDILSRNGRVLEVGHLPDDMILKANGTLTTYKLFGVTYGNGNHFKSAMCLPSPLVPQAGWYEYDGLWEHRQRGSGLKYCGKKPATPLAYCLSYALYVRQ